MTQDIIGKYLHEFKRKGENEVPEIFVLLVSYFEFEPAQLREPGIFVLGGALDRIEELRIHLCLGDYFYLTEMNKEPHVIANFFKKILS